jgi:hypothetical protein
MTITTPWRRITLQLSQRGFTDARTFTLSLLTYDDTAQMARPSREREARQRLTGVGVAPAASNHWKPLCHQLEANDERRKAQC